MHIRNTDTTGTLVRMNLVAGDAAAVINMLSQHSITGIGTNIVNHIAVHLDCILVHNTDSRIHLIPELVEMNHVVRSPVVKGSTSESYTYLTAIEQAVGYLYRIRSFSLQQSVARPINRTAVYKSAVLKQAIGTSFAQLSQHKTSIVRAQTIDKPDIAEMYTPGILKVDQTRNPCDGTVATVRTAEPPVELLRPPATRVRVVL